ncbi:zinc finger protein 583-like isoform X1 [Zootermopsis nevadensis]|uniref:zinc finger protein 583-like isoform X1 n=2 Tax=Zootermopsis nevadensis TaxID=136037 RepID=UPI000B8E69DC|nr:zinc finger protein 583-like isoform X1 [Zootermopsis nevadensis]
MKFENEVCLRTMNEACPSTMITSKFTDSARRFARLSIEINLFARSGMNKVISELSIDEIKEEPDSDMGINTFSMCQDEVENIKKEFPVTFIAVKSEPEDILDAIDEETVPDNEVCSSYVQNGSLLVDLKHEEDPLLLKFEKKNINFVDGTVQPYFCDICHKSFKYHSMLLAHCHVHSEERPFVCKVCNKAFKKGGALQRHTLVHSGVRPYSCDVCKKTFGVLGNLKHHLRTHTGERPYTCDICKKTYCESNNLKKHLKVHTGERPYVCDICEKSFYFPSDLNGHRRVHSGERPYLCDVCNKSFKHRGDMTRHVRLHTGERPYSCEICKQSFTKRYHLQNHHRIHANKNSE